MTWHYEAIAVVRARVVANVSAGLDWLTDWM